MGMLVNKIQVDTVSGRWGYHYDVIYWYSGIQGVLFHLTAPAV